MPVNIGDNRIVPDGIARIQEFDAQRLSKHRVREGDIVYSRRGDVERRALVRKSEEGWLCGTGCLKVRLGNSANPVFASYYLGHPRVREWIVRHAVGATMPNLNTAIMEAIPFVLPPRPEQDYVAHILGTLDDKIELNWKINETLEKTVLALFKDWFEGSESARSQASDLAREGILEIGDGYRAKNSELSDSGLPFIRAADLNNGFDTEGADRLCEASVAKAGNKISRVGDVAFTSKGTIGRSARVGEHTSSFVYSPQTCYWRALDPKRLHPSVLYAWMQTDDFMSQVMAVAGQTDMAPYVSLQDQRRMLVPCFPETQWDMGQRLQELQKRQSLNVAESRSLVAVRDALLPRLVSGELRNEGAEQYAGR